MKDIDFDELDKAVNSLMKNTSVDDLSQNDSSVPQEKTLEIPPPQPTVSDADAVPVIVNTPSPIARPSAIPAQHRGGRFMDMVPSSAKVKPRQSVSPSREGVDITPRAQPPIVSERPEASSPATSIASPSSDDSWPDPLEVVPATDTSTSATNTSQPKAADASDDAFESPFLSDAKVEKRPLNSETSNSPHSEDSINVSNEPSDEPPADTLPEPFIPAELDSDLIAIESSESADETKLTVTKKNKTEKSEPVAVNHRIEDHVKSAPVGAASIAQQYREQPSTGDQSHAAIYDTSQYAEPLSHPAKKKSGWLWVLWVILLLAVGAGGAVVLYMTGLI